MLLRTSIAGCLAVFACSFVQADSPVAIFNANVASYHSGFGAIDSDGTLIGRVVTLDASAGHVAQAGALVTIRQSAKVIDHVNADAQGNFRVEGLEPGIYEIIAESDNAFGAYSFQVTRGDETAQPMHVFASTLPRAEAKEVLRSMWSPAEKEEASNNAAAGQSEAPVVQTARVKAINGKIVGQVAFPRLVAEAKGLIVQAFQNGEQVAASTVGSNGRFELDCAVQGPIDVVVGGTGAYSVIGVEVVSEVQLGSTTKSTTRLVSLQEEEAAADELMVPVIATESVVEEVVVDAACGCGVDPCTCIDPCAIDPCEVDPCGCGDDLGIAGGGFYGGGGGFYGGGGGGFGGGFGGLGGLAGAAGLAVGVAALADDDDGFNVNLATGIGP